ncbi:MAG TPA: acyl-CoA dehydrogenase [Alcaligenes faecalis]|nr:acyl-CoA dehydrogenase [Alcaligenes faecalis]
MSHIAITSAALSRKLRHFVDTEIIPNELILAQGDNLARELTLDLTRRAQQAGLFGSFYPLHRGGRFGSLVEYLPVAEQEGRSEYGPGIFGADATLDAYMLSHHGSASVKQRFLTPLIKGDAVSSYAMSEPDSIGSIPATMQCQARLQEGQWHINGRKWFICRAQLASFATVVARSSDGPIDESLSMVIVPTDAVGFKVVRPLSLLGRYQGQNELSFNQVTVPEDYVLGRAGQGIALMQKRLALGRILRSVQWLGLAQRSFDIMCERIHSERGELARLVDKQLVRARVYTVYRAIASARCLLREAAIKFDAGLPNSVEVNVAKLAASDAVSQAADSAIQIMGAEGLADWSPLSGIYRAARTTHILDGADDALISTVGKHVLHTVRDSQEWGERTKAVA